jgi:hypothetical protein
MRYLLLPGILLLGGLGVLLTDPSAAQARHPRGCSSGYRGSSYGWYAPGGYVYYYTPLRSDSRAYYYAPEGAETRAYYYAPEGGETRAYYYDPASGEPTTSRSTVIYSPPSSVSDSGASRGFDRYAPHPGDPWYHSQ